MRQRLPFQIATFVSAFLLFLVQPILAKQLLPWFGGAPAVWTACLLFFQLGLTAGYLYAHVLGRLPIKWQASLHLVLLLAALVTLPMVVSASWKPGEPGVPVSPSLHVVLTLIATAGIPYVLLAATAPLLQSWWRRSSGEEPYRLYALSNAGSLVALLSFPTLVEPVLTVSKQALVWSSIYVAFVLLCAGAAWVARRAPAGHFVDARPAEDDRRPGAGDYAIWILLSACGSALLAATTNQLCQDVAVIPLLWLLPLAVYLITFIVTFGGRYPRFASTVVLVLGAVAALLATKYTAEMPLLLQIVAFLVLLAGACMVCHGELVAARPAGADLTSFYLAMSVGGVLGGVFVALAAPRLFTSFAELPIVVMLALMVAMLPASRIAASQSRHRLALAGIWLLPAIALGATIPFLPDLQTDNAELVAARRDFFGILRVQDHDRDALDPWRGLFHGRVLHGAQLTRPDRRRMPTTYYVEGSGIALAFEQHSRRIAGLPIRVGVVGLGTGTVAAFGREEDSLDFFELNPNVIDVARRFFSFLDDSRAQVRIIPGDARLSLERELAGEPSRLPYDLIVIDAFAGDSVPVHLLTRECFALYARALAPGGVVAVHVSNRHIDLVPPVHGLAVWAGLSAVGLSFDGWSGPLGGRSDWILLSSDGGFVTRAVAGGAYPLEGSSSVLWTDDYSSIVRLLR